jgi:hypothetical protein
MALWDKMKEASPAVEYAKAIVKAEMLQAENDRLTKQIEKLQDALVAAQAPKAWDSMQAAKYMTPDPVYTPQEMEARKKEEAEAEYWNKHLEYTEKPLFSDAEELVQSLGKMIGYEDAVAGQEVQPGNTES